MEKAFETLDHNLLTFGLEKNFFGQNFISWVKISLKNLEPLLTLLSICCLQDPFLKKLWLTVGIFFRTFLDQSQT